MRPVSRLSLVTLTVLLLAVLHAPAGLASGNTLYVKTSGNDSAPCTEADPCRTIKHSVSVADPGDTIQVGRGTFSEDYGVVIGKDLTVTGLSWISTQVKLGLYDSLGGCSPVFTVYEGANVMLMRMTISGGTSDGKGCFAGGIYNRGGLTLKTVRISDNNAPGIENASLASLAMTNVDVHHNFGVGLLNRGSAYVVDSRITGTYSSSPPADGLRNEGLLAVNRGLVAGNHGNGVSAGNQASGVGDCPATTDLANVTISGNSYGGVTADCGDMTLKHVTIAANTREGGGAGLNATFHDSGDSVVLLNSIVATNSGGPQCRLYGPGIISMSIAYSLVGDNSCLAWPSPDNLIGVDPKLGALSYQGCDLICRIFVLGPWKVQALLPGSPAIDRAGDAYCTATDQLGTTRPVDGDGDGVARCDMGAFEYQPPGPAGSDTR